MPSPAANGRNKRGEPRLGICLWSTPCLLLLQMLSPLSTPLLILGLKLVQLLVQREARSPFRLRGSDGLHTLRNLATTTPPHHPTPSTVSDRALLRNLLRLAVDAWCERAILCLHNAFTPSVSACERWSLRAHVGCERRHLRALLVDESPRVRCAVATYGQQERAWATGRFRRQSVQTEAGLNKQP